MYVANTSQGFVTAPSTGALDTGNFEVQTTAQKAWQAWRRGKRSYVRAMRAYNRAFKRAQKAEKEALRAQYAQVLAHQTARMNQALSALHAKKTGVPGGSYGQGQPTAYQTII